MNPVWAVMCVTALIFGIFAPIAVWPLKLVAIWCAYQYFKMGNEQ
jgi:hypothetical protein